jgi:hypothetical protein
MIRRVIGRIGRWWHSDRWLSILLVTLVLMLFVLSPLRAHRGLGAGFGTVLFFVVLFAGVGATSMNPLFARITAAIVAAAAMVFLVNAFVDTEALWTAGRILGFLSLGVMVYVILRSVFRPGPITMHRVQGAVAAYLLFGLMWATLYAIVITFDANALHDGRGLPIAPEASDTLFYFSFVTLATLGYGDVVPVNSACRSLAVVEALTGQLYPAILIARLVVLQIGSKSSARDLS